ncbi:nuclear transport factor 2 family protein [Caballeronia sp. GAFFF3]|uniref:nuclear transport factor 2 family protein n=1 Tax=Caballeronia sp. GAFFF3 TaxID=2921759 RepID=UPI002028AAC9|nr:nuclear transport factor 2 family protein [Caballeronia sp. GAFFF3]
MTVDTSSFEALQARVARLEAIDAIRTMKARYASLADAKYTKDYRRQPDEVMRDIAQKQAACFTDDAIWRGGAGFGEDLCGRTRIAEWFERSPWRFAMHYYVGETLDVTSETSAIGTWRLWQLALRHDDSHAVLLGAVTEERYARVEAGDWRIAEMRFTQVQMMEPHTLPMPLASDFASLNALRNLTKN